MEPIALNVFRWSVFVAGIGYGYTHYNSLLAKKKIKQEEDLYKRKERVIREAQMEYAKLSGLSSLKTDDLTVIVDPNDKNFDLEAYLNNLETKIIH
ncbi:hypothetical protein PCANB_000076 [Pneumocystis canis]|nr:hypothetical protein PCK1_000211 [Pneumocystis canis]KAG5439794.1 hypothetical protein PCANB_000076 [Pneumocystis canis]